MTRHDAPIIVASLCDSRSCNQTGGGEHLKPDIEDLLSLIPFPGDFDTNNAADSHANYERRKADSGKNCQHRATLTTCFGLCNHSPNIQIKSTGSINGPALQGRSGKLVNDGGFRMRMVEDDETEDLSVGSSNEEESDRKRKGNRNCDNTMKATDVVMISNATISKVATAIGLDGPEHYYAVRALEYQTEGNKSRREHCLKDALDRTLEGRSLLLTYFKGGDDMNSDTNAESNLTEGDYNKKSCLTKHNLNYPAIKKLLLKMTLSCVRIRIQLATEYRDRTIDEATKMLQIASRDAFQVLLKSLTRDNGEGSNTEDKDIQSTIRNLENCSAGTLTSQFFNGYSQVQQEAGEHFMPSIDCGSFTYFAQFFVALGDAWISLGEIENTASYKDGALIALRGALLIASKRKRALKGKERRRIERAITSLL